ncbi:MAG: hypothetical protein CL569_14945 [Alphaproteobacteria bacterium]|nr:hypothetical protein [Alphaproteobacteria bacterium]
MILRLTGSNGALARSIDHPYLQLSSGRSYGAAPALFGQVSGETGAGNPSPKFDAQLRCTYGPLWWWQQPAQTIGVGVAREEGSALEQARQRVITAGQWSPSQALGRRYPIGCVALETTQRCNLDCTLCYLSENAEAVKDAPLAELHRRIDDVHIRYGPHTDVQVAGGEPTLRRREDLVAIVKHIAAMRMRPALFTNGIRAKRELLEELSDAGLVDVAFHVDLTQERRGYATKSRIRHS